MQRWEYCSVFSGRITFYRVSGTTTRPIKRDKAQGDRDDDDAFNRAIAQLGLDGWEYAGMSGLASRGSSARCHQAEGRDIMALSP